MTLISSLIADPAQADGKRRRALPVLIGVIGLALGGFSVLNAIAYPWSVSLFGRPALVGEWYGELITPTGRKHWIALDLSAEPTGRNLNFRRLKGSAHICGARGMRGYEGSNKPQNWRGTQFNIAMFATDERLDGLTLMKLDGEWDGREVIRATSRFETSGPVTVSVDRSGTVTRPGADPDAHVPAALTLRRGSERDFATACARLLPHAAMNPDRR